MTEQKITSIMAELPQVVFVMEQVGAAIDLAKEKLSEEELDTALCVALEVAKYARETSTENYYKYHLVVTALLCNVEDVQKEDRYSMFRTTANTIGKGIDTLQITEEEEARGIIKGGILYLARLRKVDAELFLIAILEIIDRVSNILGKTIKSTFERLYLVGIAYTDLNLRMNASTMITPIQDRYNRLTTLLEKTVF